MLSHDFPLDHDITGDEIRKAKKQTGRQPKGAGSVYINRPKNDIVAHVTNGEWGMFKVGLASGGEGKNFKILSDQRTANGGCYDQIRNYPVLKVGLAEANAHQKLGQRGWRPLHGMDFNIPEEHKYLFERQRGGTEWVCGPTLEFLEMMDNWFANYKGRKKSRWHDGWVGQTITDGVETASPIIFQFNSKGLPYAANLRNVGRNGRPPEIEALEYAWNYRVLTGFAPNGCCSLTV